MSSGIWRRRPAAVVGPSSRTHAPVCAKPLKRVYSVSFHLIVFLSAYTLFIFRRPGAVLNAQFYAEDAVVWFLDAYNRGIQSIFESHVSYLHILKRFVALSSLLFPFSAAPLVMNLCAIAAQALPVNVFLSSRFSRIPMGWRLLASLLYLALPNTYEIDATITNTQWYTAVLAFLLLLARPTIGRGWRIFDAIVLIVTSLDGPMGIVLLPVAGAMWWKRRCARASLNVGLLIPGTCIQVFSIFFAWHSRQTAPIGASVSRLIIILGRQIFIPFFVGLKTTRLAGDHPLTLIEIIAASIGVALLLYALRYAPVELKLAVIFAFGVLALSLARPLAGPPGRLQWEWLCIPGLGNRYYFLPMLSFLAALLWTAINKTHRTLRYLAVALLLLTSIGIYRDWRYPEYTDLEFKKYAAEFERAPAGTKISIPINPNPPVAYTLELIKH